MKKSRREESRRYYLKNREQISLRAKARYQKNKEAVKQRSLEYYHSKIRPNKARLKAHIERSVRANQKMRREKYLPIKLHLQKLLGGKCKKCKESNHIVLDFDHKDPKTKLMSISQNYHLPIQELEEEIKKCQLLCANCHRVKTWNSGGFSPSIRKFRNPKKFSTFNPIKIS